MDGFVAQRPQRMSVAMGEPTTTTVGRQGAAGRTTIGNSQPAARQVRAAGNSIKQSIASSLEAIDQTTPDTPRQKRKKQRRKRLIVKLISLGVMAIIALVAGFLLYKAWNTARQIFGDGNLFGLFQEQPLKKDAHGRSNLLIVGTTDDEPDRPGATLTDSMMILSVDQDKKDAYMLSVPRDLYVKFGKACNSGYAGKINEYFQCADEGTDDAAERRRMDAIRSFVGKIFGMDIQYVAHVNTLVIRDAVNAVGGITVNVQSRDSRGILDPSLDWMCTQKGLTREQQRERCPTGHYLHLKNGPATLDGDKAMWFSRARGAFGGYGLEESNFDREKNQQLVIAALKEKAASTGTLTDFGKITGLIDTMGKNLRMNIETKEIRTIMKVASQIQPEAIHRLSLVEKDNVLVTTGTANGASIVRPVAGLHDYSEIRAYVKSQLYATPVSREHARVMVLNGGAPEGKAKEESEKLASIGMVIRGVDNAPKKLPRRVTIYAMEGAEQKTATRDKLKELYGVDTTTESAPFRMTKDVDFVIVFGEE